VRIGQDLDLLDSPGILPMQFSDQAAATKLAICDDIGERSYEIDGVAVVLIEILKRLPTARATVLQKRYKIDADDCCGESRLFKGDVNQAAYRILHGFRKGKFGWIALEKSP
jgi:ribosome biogenesis GTPase A